MSQIPIPRGNQPTPPVNPEPKADSQPAAPASPESKVDPKPTATPTPEPTSVRTFSIQIEYGKFVSCADDISHQRIGKISDDNLTLKTDVFTARISHATPGRLVVEYDDQLHDGAQVFYRVLRDGVFEVITGKKPQARWRHIKPLEELYRERFGITQICHGDPNCSYAERSCQHEGPDGHHHFCFVRTDGKVRAFLTDDVMGHFDPDDPEDMFFYNGEVEYCVKGATWAVVGTATTDADSSFLDKTICLYVDSHHPNLYLLALELDQYLQDHDHGSFDDYIGELKDLV